MEGEQLFTFDFAIIVCSKGYKELNHVHILFLTGKLLMISGQTPVYEDTIQPEFRCHKKPMAVKQVSFNACRMPIILLQ